MSSPVASTNDSNTGGRVGMDRAQESEVFTRRDPGGSIRTVSKTRISTVKTDNRHKSTTSD
jgi:1,2-phenylacetyl-CoA epoxidase PaaB subunit